MMILRLLRMFIKEWKYFQVEALIKVISGVIKELFALMVQRKFVVRGVVM